jgi:hypothetical protein
MYSLNKPAERSYCEKKLKIFHTNIPVIALVEHRNLVVRKIIARQDNITDAPKSVMELLNRANTAASQQNNDMPYVNAVLTCRNLESSGAPGVLTSSFRPTDTLYASSEVYGLRVGSKVIAKWYHDSKQISSGTIVSDREGDYFVHFELEPHGQWAKGTYRIVISAGTSSTKAEFHVR